MPEPIPITAVSLSNGLGRTAKQVWDKLERGQPGFAPCPLDLPFSVPAGVVPGELPAPDTRFAASDSRTLRVALLAAEQIRDAVRVAIDRYGPRRVGLVVGTSTGGIEVSERAYFARRAGGTAPEFDYLSVHPFHRIARVVGLELGVRGPTYVVSTACSSSAKVFCSGRRLLASGRCDAVIVGGADGLCLTTVRGFHSLGVYQDTPCRPFSAARQGMTVGEGAAFALLDPGGLPLAHLLGTGESSDAFHMSAPDPSGTGAQLAMRRALEDAGLTPEQVSYVNAHGTGTVRNDSAEATAIASVFGTHTPVVSTKSYTGHLLGAGGATEALFAMGAIERGWIPGNLGLEPRDPEIDLDLPAQRRACTVEYALSNSFAFGGNNVSLVFGGAGR